MNAVCDLCGASDSIEIGVLTDLYLFAPGVTRLRRCRRCGLVWSESVEPALISKTLEVSETSRVSASRQRLKRAALARRGYPRSETSQVSKTCEVSDREVYAWLGRLLSILLAGRLDKIPDYVPAGRLLDVGCGAGQYVAALRALGWRAVGLDIASRAAAILGRAEDLPLESAAFDVVTFWHSLEHTASPARALREAGRLLRPGGALLLEVPNLASIQARLCGRYWLHLDPPRHRYHLTPATLRAYLEGAGFAEIVVWSVPSAVGWTGSLQTRLNALTGRRLHGLLRSRLIAALLWPLAALEAALGAGGCLRARARRPA